MRIRDLERSLFERFPREDAESWDHVGLSVGMPDAEVAGICVALDATEANVREAARIGANVLLTHHPVYIKAPDAFAPASPERPVSSAAIFTAAQLGVSILSYHTNLDRSLEARKQLPSLLGLSPISSLEHPDDASAVDSARCARYLALSSSASLRNRAQVPLAPPRAYGARPDEASSASHFWEARWDRLAKTPSLRVPTSSSRVRPATMFAKIFRCVA